MRRVALALVRLSAAALALAWFMWGNLGFLQHARHNDWPRVSAEVRSVHVTSVDTERAAARFIVRPRAVAQRGLLRRRPAA